MIRRSLQKLLQGALLASVHAFAISAESEALPPSATHRCTEAAYPAVSGLALSAAIDLAWCSSSVLDIQRADLQEARADLANAAAQFRPTVDATGSVTHTSSTVVDNRNANLGLQSSWNLWDGGRRDSAQKSAGTRTLASAIDLQDRYRMVALETIKVFLEKMYATEAVRAESLTIRAAQVTLDAATARQQAGVGASLDVLKARSNLAQAQLEGQRSQANDLQASVRLAAAIGQSELALDKVQTIQVASWSLSPNELPSLVNAAFRQRLALQSAAQRVQSAQADVEKVKAQGAPQISLTSAFRRTASDSALLQQSTNDASIGVNLTHNFYDGGVRRAMLDAALARQDKAHAQVQSTQREIELEVRLKLSQVLFQQDALAQSKASLDAAIEVERNSLGRYQAGAATLLEVFDAQSRLATTRRQAVQAQTDLLKAQAELQSSTGQQRPLLDHFPFGANP